MTEYIYAVTEVYPETKTMVLVYTSEQYGTMTVSARMPWEGEDLASIAAMYSPMRYWIEQTLPLANVVVGTTGVLSYVEALPEIVSESSTV